MLKNLKSLRKELGFTQNQLADLLNISQQTYSDYENCKTEPTTDTLVKLAEIFDVTIDELVDITPEERAAGASLTKKETIVPIEYEMLYIFRQIGKRFGEQAQRDYMTVGENMLKLK